MSWTALGKIFPISVVVSQSRSQIGVKQASDTAGFGA
jgi:hypothetical protein